MNNNKKRIFKSSSKDYLISHMVNYQCSGPTSSFYQKITKKKKKKTEKLWERSQKRQNTGQTRTLPKWHRNTHFFCQIDLHILQILFGKKRSHLKSYRLRHWNSIWVGSGQLVYTVNLYYGQRFRELSQQMFQ